MYEYFAVLRVAASSAADPLLFFKPTSTKPQAEKLWLQRQFTLLPWCFF